MTKLTIELDDHVAEQVAKVAAERGVAPAQLAGEAVTEKFGAPRRRLAFVGLGRSTSGRRASEDEDMLADGFGR